MFTKYIHISKSKGVPYVQFKAPQMIRVGRTGDDRMEKAARSWGTSSEKGISTEEWIWELWPRPCTALELSLKAARETRTVLYSTAATAIEHTPLRCAVSVKDEPDFKDPKWEMSCQISFLLQRQGLTNYVILVNMEHTLETMLASNSEISLTKSPKCYEKSY